MKWQLIFWPLMQKAPRGSQDWEAFDPKQRSDLIAALARLITKATLPENLNNSQEDENERQYKD